MKRTTRRELFGAIGFAAGVSILPGYAGEERCRAATQDADACWHYVPLEPAAVGDEAYRLMPEGGCMYGAFRAVLAAWLNKAGHSPDSFPFHMMRYGEGGIGGWGTICGTLNAGAAVIGLFERDKKRREKLIAELFTWYEHTELPIYLAPGAEPGKAVKSVAGSVLCHVSLNHWHKASGAAIPSNRMKQRCRCLTADVAAKTVELLNRSQDAEQGTDEPTTPSSKPVTKPPQVICKMQCTACHNQ